MLKTDRLFMVRLKSLFLFVSALWFLSACTKQEDVSKIQIQFPEAGSQSFSASSKTVGTLSEEIPWSGHITSRDEINCYFIAIGGVDPIHRRNQCKIIDANAAVVSSVEFGRYEGGIPAGSLIDIPIKPEGNLIRFIYLVGMKAEAGYCRNFHGEGPVDGKLSYPRILGMQTVELKPGDVDVSFSVPSDLTALQEIGECQVEDLPMNGDGGGTTTPPISMFGDERDGDFTFNVGTIFSTGNSGLRYDNASTTLSNSMVPGTKYFSANMRVISIDISTRTILTLNGAFTADHFDVGDEVMWHVSQANTDSSCGSGLPGGSHGFAKIMSTDLATHKIILDKPISNSWSNLYDANLSTSAYDSGTNHCRIQVLRVPSFNILKFDSAVTLQPPAYDPSLGYGGILAFRAKKIILNANATLDVIGAGFPGSSTNTSGNLGKNSNTSGAPSGTAGGYSANAPDYAGGGGNGGDGGDSYITSGSATGGNSITVCTGAACLPMTDQKFFFGGSGGGDGSNSGGAGGGAIVLHVKEFAAASSVSFAMAANGSTALGDAAGGAGGSVHISHEISPANVTLSILANGGAAGASGSGGGGGGGVIENRYCSATTSLSESFSYDGGAGGAGGSPGYVGNTGLQSSLSAPSICGQP